MMEAIYIKTADLGANVIVSKINDAAFINICVRNASVHVNLTKEQVQALVAALQEVFV